MTDKRQRIALLGATGSIGEQALAVARAYAESYEVIALTAGGNWVRLAEQAREFMPDCVVIADKTHYGELKDALADLPIKVYAGDDAICQVAAGGNVDVVINAIVGYAGLPATIAALEAGKKLALANKESLVVAGELVMRLSAENRAPIIPVDSEHSAIFQCLAGETGAIHKLILTASGGPFLHTPTEELAHVTAEEALRHPNWNMGAKITVDSATLMNKGFEVIEAHWLFGMPAERIEVLVHPQSVIHSMVEFADGAIKAQLGTADMKLPIQYALTFPHRLQIDGGERLDFTKFHTLTFSAPDHNRFPALGLAYEALRSGGNACCVLNAANEVAVAAFLAGRIGFNAIPRIAEQTLARATRIAHPTSDDYIASNAEARALAAEIAHSQVLGVR
jgi:1-deoxy-D-xylulose-5-phosphate reductoisomerase